MASYAGALFSQALKTCLNLLKLYVNNEIWFWIFVYGDQIRLSDLKSLSLIS